MSWLRDQQYGSLTGWSVIVRAAKLAVQKTWSEAGSVELVWTPDDLLLAVPE